MTSRISPGLIWSIFSRVWNSGSGQYSPRQSSVLTALTTSFIPNTSAYVWSKLSLPLFHAGIPGGDSLRGFFPDPFPRPPVERIEERHQNNHIPEHVSSQTLSLAFRGVGCILKKGGNVLCLPGKLRIVLG